MAIFQKRIKLINKIMKIMQRHDFTKGERRLLLNILIEIRRYELEYEDLNFEMSYDWFRRLTVSLYPSKDEIRKEQEKIDSPKETKASRKRRREAETNEENAKKAKIDNRCPIHKRHPCNECMKREWIEAGRTECEKNRMRERGEELDKLLEEF